MPANLTPQYDKADKQYRQAASDDERLEALREMLRAIPKHKGTEKMQADLKRRISQLRKVVARTSSGRGPDPFHVPKSGAGQVVLVGTPNAGKSSLLAATTHASVKVTDYPFATALPTPGMWAYDDAQIELVDTPPVTAEHVPAGLISTIRAADVIAVVVDATEPLRQADRVLDLLAARKLHLRSVPRTQLDASDPSQRSGLVVATQVDRAPADDVTVLRELYAGQIDVLAVSAVTGEGLDALRDRLWQMLAVLRVYTKKPGQDPDNAQPFTLSVGATVEDLARAIHRELPETMKSARLWGHGRFAGQHVPKSEPLHDRDIVEIHE